VTHRPQPSLAISRTDARGTRTKDTQGDDAMIDVHYVPTINGQKIVMMLEETGLKYNLRFYDPMAGDHLTPEYNKINPNHKLPAIVDNDPSDGGPPLPIFETGAILLYLAEKTGKLMPTDFRRREIARQWLIWQVAGMGPMHGQANHFVRYAPPGQDYAVARYMKESRRLMDVLESRLRGRDYIADEFSIADIACWAFVSSAHVIDIDVADYPAIARWKALIDERPSTARVVSEKVTRVPFSIMKPRMELTSTQWDNLFGEANHQAARANSEEEAG
jgi:GSH-dependent disulfide-bond oxidoreductase